MALHKSKRWDRNRGGRFPKSEVLADKLQTVYSYRLQPNGVYNGQEKNRWPWLRERELNRENGALTADFDEALSLPLSLETRVNGSRSLTCGQRAS